MHVVSDSIIALAYYTIPVGLVYFIRKRPDVPFDWIFVMFATFILACGTTHLMGIWNIWNPDYWLSGVVKVVTAAASIGTAITLIPLIPRALKVPSPKQLEAAVTEGRRAEIRFRSILAAAPDALVIVNSEGYIQLVNAQAEKLFGYGRDELLGLAIDLLVPARLGDIHPAHRAAYAREPLPRPMGGQLHLFAQRKDGSEVPVEISLSPLETDEGLLVMAAVRDVTERRALEAQLLQAQKMEAIGRLAGGVAHDFNNVLTAILCSADLLLEDLAAADTRREEVEEIHESAERAAALTHQLLAFSRKQVLQPEVLNLDAVVANVQKMLQRLIPENMELLTVLAGDLGAVLADRGQIEQVILNLALNARDAMPTGGQLTIETANVELDEEYTTQHAGVVPGRYVMLAVSDTGVGMDEETKMHLFEPFFSTKGPGRGTGLGLPTVYGIVKQSGGNIWVYSEPGQGAAFKIYLPRVEAAPTAEGPAKLAARGGSETILLVEDAKSVRTVTRRLLEAYGYTVLEASGGADALRVARDHRGPIDLLLTDIVMPGVSGTEVARQLAELRPGVRVLYMSGYTDNAIVHHGVLDPGIAFLQKPFTREGLAHKVREVLERG
jgi:hypothetical protein